MALNSDRRVCFEYEPHRVGTWPEIPIGQTVELPRRLWTFSGCLSPGPVVIEAGVHDWHGFALVNLSRGGRIVACGVEWPFAEEPSAATPIVASEALPDAGSRQVSLF